MSRILPGLLAPVLLTALAAGQTDFQPRQGEPLRLLSAADLALFFEGQAAFNTPLPEADGLGPIFNDGSCGNCHSHPAIGGSSTRTVTRFGKAATGGLPFDPLLSLGGTLRQEQALSQPCEEVVPPEATVTTERLTPITFGAGLLTAISDADVLNNQLAQPSGYFGAVSTVSPLEGGPARAAKFGWKGGVATTMSFSIDASLNEMGLTSVFLPQENAPNGNAVTLSNCDAVSDPEDAPDVNGRTRIDKFTNFQRFLAPPPQTPQSGTSGEALFDAVGCGVCHTSSAYVTQPTAWPALSGVSIKPYSDFLLHDMGALGDGFVEANASETQMMTRALWGVGSRTALLHDGSATGGSFGTNVDTAIQAHDGEGAASKLAYNALTAGDQALVVAFLRSLGRAEFDYEADNDVDEFDWFFIRPDFTGPLGSFTPDDPGALSDVDQDGDFDLADFAVTQRAYTGNL
ncbi:MAG: hypothetical protein H6828_09470 [Planctomycetes bacterium]|nr:hypothetical protein [Planctomycetota bacterium]